MVGIFNDDKSYMEGSDWMSPRNARNRVTIITFVTLLVLACGAYVYVATMREMIQSSVMENLKGIVELTNRSVKTRITDSLDNLSSISTLLENEKSDDIQKLALSMKKTCDQNMYRRMGIADVNGNVYTTDDQSFNIADRDYFQSALKGEKAVSSILDDKLSKDEIQVYAVPLHFNDEIIGVLFATLSATVQEEQLLVENFQDEGFSAIFDRNGNVVLNDIVIQNQVIPNINDLHFQETFHLQDIQVNGTGVNRFHDEEGKEWYFVYTKMDIEDWFVCCIIPASIVSAQLNQFITLAAISWFSVAIIFTMIMFYIYFTHMKNKKKIDTLAYHDTLVNHYNYHQFTLNVQPILLDESEQLRYALVEFDVSDFKLFNELYGYHMGDKLLANMMSCMEDLSFKDEYCARISADRFILLWQERVEKKIVSRIEQLCDRIRQTFTIQLDGVNLNFHVGVYLLEGKEKDLAKNHDKTTYAENMINEVHEDAIAFFSNEMYERIVEEKKLENRMEEALNNHEFLVYIQPKVRVSNEEIQSAEALVRWLEPTRGLLSPGIFIPLFEKNGFLQRLDMYMIREVCAWLAKCKGEGKKLIPISVNVSRSYIFKNDFVKDLIQLVSDYQISPNLLEIEITESVIFDRVDELKTIIHELNSYGFRIAMDDFGSGYSSLNMLKEIPIQVIKLDQAFFRTDVNDEKRSRMIVQGVIELAKILGLEVVAEGIEKKEQVAFLSEKGCDFIQGYYFYKPMPIAEFEQL